MFEQAVVTFRVCRERLEEMLNLSDAAPLSHTESCWAQELAIEAARLVVMLANDAGKTLEEIVDGEAIADAVEAVNDYCDE
jgi:hypothetical protein